MIAPGQDSNKSKTKVTFHKDERNSSRAGRPARLLPRYILHGCPHLPPAVAAWPLSRTPQKRRSLQRRQPLTGSRIQSCGHASPSCTDSHVDCALRTPSFSEKRNAARPQPAGCLDAGWPAVRIVYVLGREPASKYLVRVRTSVRVRVRVRVRVLVRVLVRVRVRVYRVRCPPSSTSPATTCSPRGRRRSSSCRCARRLSPRSGMRPGPNRRAAWTQRGPQCGCGRCPAEIRARSASRGATD